MIKGPFTLQWGDNIIDDVEEIDLDVEATANDYETNMGVHFEIDKTNKAICTLTLLGSDLPIIEALLPQHFVPQGGTMSTGEVVSEEQGAFDWVPRKCNPSTVYHPLDIVSCSNQQQRTRLVNCRTKLAGYDITSKLQKIMIKFIGEPAPNQGVIQMFRQISPAPETVLKLDDGSVFTLDDGKLLELDL